MSTDQDAIAGTLKCLRAFGLLLDSPIVVMHLHNVGAVGCTTPDLIRLGIWLTKHDFAGVSVVGTVMRTPTDYCHVFIKLGRTPAECHKNLTEAIEAMTART